MAMPPAIDRDERISMATGAGAASPGISGRRCRGAMRGNGVLWKVLDAGTSGRRLGSDGDGLRKGVFLRESCEKALLRYVKMISEQN